MYIVHMNTTDHYKFVTKIVNSPVVVLVDDDDDVVGGVGLNVADDDDNFCVKFCWILDLIIRADWLWFCWFNNVIGSRLIIVSVVGGFEPFSWFEGLIWTKDWDLGGDGSLLWIGSSIKLVNKFESGFSINDIDGGDGDSFVGSLRCLIIVIARLNCAVNFCFGCNNSDDMGVDDASTESVLIKSDVCNGLESRMAVETSNIFLLIVFSRFILPRFRPTRAARKKKRKQEEKIFTKRKTCGKGNILTFICILCWFEFACV